MDELLERLRATRSDYKSEFSWVRFLMDSYAGTGGYRGRVKAPDSGFWGWAAEAYGSGVARTLLGDFDDSDSYLDRYPREDETKFRKRVETSVFTNYCGPILDLLVSYVLKEQTSRELPDALTEWCEDVDGKGTTWAEFIEEHVAPRTAICGWLPVLFDAPRVNAEGLEGPLTVAQAREQGIRPRAIQLYPANLLDWSLDETGNFEWVKIRLDYQRQPDPLGKAHKIERYQLWFPDRVVWFDVIVRDGEEPQVGQRQEATHAFGGVPVAIFRAKPALDDDVRGISLIHEAAPQNRRHFNLLSELDEQLRGTTFPILQVPVRQFEDVQSITVGIDNALPLYADSSQPYQFIEPSGQSAEAYEKRIESTVREIYRTMRVEHERPNGQATSGIAHAYRFAQTNRRLSDFAKQLARGEAWAMSIVGPAIPVSDEELRETRITPPASFDVENLLEELQKIQQALGLGLGPTAEMVLRRRIVDRLAPNLDEATRGRIEDELEQQREDEVNTSSMDRELDELRRMGQGEQDGKGDESDGENGDEDET